MEKQWYFNTVTEQPELGMISPASHRMGPYKTREDALDAWTVSYTHLTLPTIA